MSNILNEEKKPVKNKFIGMWKLVNFELKDLNGNTLHPFGENATGICIIEKNGYLSAQVMRCDRPKFVSELPAPEEIQAAYKSYLAYYGKININEKNGTFNTRVEGSLNPDWVGTDQLRYFEFSDNNLILRIPPMKLNNIEFTGTFTWKKVD